MPRAKAEDRVLGPYTETDPRTGKDRHRLIVHQGGKVSRPIFDSLDGPSGALAVKAQLESAIVSSRDRTIEEALVAWEAYRREEGIKAETLRNCGHQARGFFLLFGLPSLLAGLSLIGTSLRPSGSP